MIAVDELEVFLKFEIALANRLALPIGTRHMYYEGCASCVTQADLDAAQQEAEQAANHSDRLDSFLATWAPWQTYLRSQQQPKSWLSLAETSLLSMHQEMQCGINLEPYAKLDDPVTLLDRAGSVYSYALLLQNYLERGHRPDCPQPLDWAIVRRLPIVHSPQCELNHRRVLGHQ